ncbi:phytanoyl-CoA dioxygenase family protein [Allosphingosinicella deserti]|nr:phytanoyl-CoA dioxygenase family protein [Sphingomonas deserti]
MLEPQFATAETASDFRRLGYAVAPLLTADEVSAVRGALDGLMRDHAKSGRSDDDLRQGHITYYNADGAYQEAVAALVRATFTPVLDRIVSGYRVSAGGAFIKPPGGGEMGVHCDYRATTDPDAVTFTLWCALADVDEANGALCLLPGSHKVRDQIIGPGVSPYFESYPDRIKSRSVPVRVRAGEALLFQTGMIHWSLPNRSDRLRPAIHFIAVPADAPHVIYMPKDSVPPKRFEILDLSDVLAFHPGVHPPSLGSIDHSNRPIGWPELERLVDEAVGAPPKAAPAGLWARSRTLVRRAFGA